MNNLTESLVTIAMGIIGVAILSTLVSQRAQTSQVLSAAGNAFGQDLAVAMGGVTGYTYGGGNAVSTGMNSLSQMPAFGTGR